MGDPAGQAYGGGILTPTPLDELARRTGNELGISDYVPIAQQTVDASRSEKTLPPRTEEEEVTELAAA